MVQNIQPGKYGLIDGLLPFTNQINHFSSHRMGQWENGERNGRCSCLLLLSEEEKKNPSAYEVGEVFPTHGHFCRVGVDPQGTTRWTFAVLLVRSGVPIPLSFYSDLSMSTAVALVVPAILSHLLQCPPPPAQSIWPWAFAYLPSELAWPPLR